MNDLLRKQELQKHQKSIRHSQGGFTLVELMMTLIIAAILLTQGVPGFSSFIQDNRLITKTNDLVADINLARSEAITRGVGVTICSSANPNAGTTCNGTWTNGWLVYADDDGDGAFNSATDTLLRIGQAATGEVAVASNATAGADLAFNAEGATNEGGTAIFAICDDRGVNEGRQINVNSMGRPRLISAPIGSCSP